MLLTMNNVNRAHPAENTRSLTAAASSSEGGLVGDGVFTAAATGGIVGAAVTGEVVGVPVGDKVEQD